MNSSQNPVRTGQSGMALAGLAFAMAAAFTLLTWLQGGTPFTGDPVFSTDDMVRMVTVRDWLGGQSWYDPVLHRLGPAPGTLMHWSRLVDLPLGMLVLAGNTFGLEGERLAVIVWPFLTFFAAAAGFLVAVRRASASLEPVPSFVIGGFAFIGVNVFASGVVDHHNVQLALTLWLVALLTPGGNNTRRDFALAALVTGLMLAIGMEGLPLAVAGALAVYARLLLQGGSLVPSVRAYGLVLALAQPFLIVLLVSPARYGTATCDAYSLFHFTACATGGLVLWAGLSAPVRFRLARAYLIVPLVAAIVVAATTALFFPDCLGNPIAGLDPKMREFWIDKVIETQSLFQIARLDPWLLPYILALPLLALVAGIKAAVGEFPRFTLGPAMIFLLAATGVTLFQMRGSQFSTPLAALVLAILVTRFSAVHAGKMPIRYLAYLALSCLMVWKVAVFSAISLFAGGNAGPLVAAAAAGGGSGCMNPSALALLKQQLPGLVAAPNNLGPAILYATPHRVLAGPYHRNVDGNLAWIDAMIAPADESKTIFARLGVSLLVSCPDDPDEAEFKAAAPSGLAADMLSGNVPDWLEPATDAQPLPLRLYRVKQ